MLTPQEAEQPLHDPSHDGAGGPYGDRDHAQAERGEGRRRSRHRPAEREARRHGVGAEATQRSLAALMVRTRRSTRHGVPASSLLATTSHSTWRGSTVEGDRGGPALHEGLLVDPHRRDRRRRRRRGQRPAQLAEALYGCVRLRARSGSAAVLKAGDPLAAIAAGIANVPEDRLGTGLAPSVSVAGNVVLKSYAAPVSRGPLLADATHA